MRICSKAQLDEEAQELGPVMECLLTDAWKTNGDRGMRESLKRFCGGQEQPVRIRWVWFESTDEDSPLAANGDRRLFSSEHGELEATGPDGDRYLVIYWPVKLATERQGGLEFAHPIAALTANQRDIMIADGPADRRHGAASACCWPCCWASASSAGRWNS